MTHFRTGKTIKIFVPALAAVLLHVCGFSQNTTIVDTAHPATATVIAGKEYKKGSFGRTLWGAHYRDLWTMPVNVSKLHLDTAFGGLTPAEKGGGRQTKNLRLDAADKRQYAIRSINKDYGKALPEEAQGTFIESIVKDQMSVAHPYAGVTLPVLSAAAKVYSTKPRIVFIGNDPVLGQYKEEFRNELYSLEDRPAEKNAKFYGAKHVLDTEDLLDKILQDNRHRADAASFARARLFDMFISDWDRHDEQWKWAEYDENGTHIYKAIPKDRDQAFSKFDGLLVKVAAKATHLPYLQGFGNDIKDIEGFNLEARPLDMQLTNEMTLENWRSIAKDMQQSLNDAVIEKAIGALPPEVYAASGKEMIGFLRSRRDHLVEWAEEYYHDLAKNVDITATRANETIEVTGIDNDHVKVSMFAIRDGNTSKTPFYSRAFSADETREIRIYGIGGNDRFVANGNTGNRILVRWIGGDKKDAYNVPSSFDGKIKIYDDKENDFNTGGAKKYLSSDSLVHRYDRKAFKPGSSGIGPRLGYNNEDRTYIGIGYKTKQQQWRKVPFGYSHDLAVKYSIEQKAFSFTYKGVFNELIGKWNLGALAEYDLVRDAYFMGIGNNTVKLDDKAKHYYQYKNIEGNAALNVYRTFDSAHTISFSGFYQMVDLLEDPGTYLSDVFIPIQKPVRNAQHFAGARINYDFTKVNDKLVPRKGVRFNVGAEQTWNTGNSNTVTRFTGLFGFYLPLGPLTLAVKTGAATLTGDPEFYQLNKIGGGTTLRGYARYRFYGNSMFYNQNELQWNFNVKTYLFSGKMGLLALFDNGRVWNAGETSDAWHTAIGGGLMLAPFNRISVTATYAVSKEDGRINIRFTHLLKK